MFAAWATAGRTALRRRRRQRAAAAGRHNEDREDRAAAHRPQMKDERHPRWELGMSMLSGTIALAIGQLNLPRRALWRSWPRNWRMLPALGISTGGKRLWLVKSSLGCRDVGANGTHTARRSTRGSSNSRRSHPRHSSIWRSKPLITFSHR